jgi:hypothetical protein
MVSRTDMVPILFRAFSTIVTVVIAVVVSATVGDSSFGKVWAAVLIASVIALVEWLLIWAPKHSTVARKLLDRRSNMIGVWLQTVDKVIHGKADNRFSIFWISSDSDIYKVDGFAYDSRGVEAASWHSVGSPDFAPDFRSMTYRWEGTIEDHESKDDPGRIGVASFNLDGHTSRVEHVGMRLNLVVRFQPVTTEWLKAKGFDHYQPNDLKTNQTLRDSVALAYATSPHSP